MIELLAMARDPKASWTQRRRCCLDLLAAAYGRRGIVPPAAELVAGVAAELQGIAAGPLPVAAAEPPRPAGAQRRPVRLSLVR